MKKLFYGLVIILLATFMVSCSSSFTTVAEPSPMKPMLITSGDLPTKKYVVLGFVESRATRSGLGFPNETEFSRMKSEALNRGLVAKAEQMGADAIISVKISSNSYSQYYFFNETVVYATGSAIKFVK